MCSVLSSRECLADTCDKLAFKAQVGLCDGSVVDAAVAVFGVDASSGAHELAYTGSGVDFVQKARVCS